MPSRLSQCLTRRGRLALVLALSLLAAPAVSAPAAPLPRELPHPSHHLAHGYRNLDPTYDYTLLGRTWNLLRHSLDREPPRGRPPVPVANDGAALRANGT